MFSRNKDLFHSEFRVQIDKSLKMDFETEILLRQQDKQIKGEIKGT